MFFFGSRESLGAGSSARAGQGTGQCPTHFSQATGETRFFRRTLTCPLYRLGELPAAIDEATSTMDKLMSHYDEMHRQMTDKKKEEIENAYQRYLYEKTKEEGVNRDDKGNKIGSTIKV